MIPRRPLASSTLRTSTSPGTSIHKMSSSSSVSYYCTNIGGDNNNKNKQSHSFTNRQPGVALGGRKFAGSSLERPPRYPKQLTIPSLVRALDYLGTVAFAVSGTLVAAAANMDIMGCVIVGGMTAVGGGTLRDVLFGKRPVFFLTDIEYLYIALFVPLATFVLCTILYGGSLSNWPLSERNSIGFFCDALGVGAFCVVGTMAAVRRRYGFWSCVFAGLLTSTGGRVLRDVFCNRPVRILHSHKEVYGTAAICGSSAYLLMKKLKAPVPYRMLSGVLVGFGLRVAAVEFDLRLPVLEEAFKADTLAAELSS
eukprot:PhM_4_TR19066/c0_g1_i1/m.15367